MILIDKIKQTFPDMKKGIERFPLTIVFSATSWILSIFLFESIEKGIQMSEVKELFILSILGIVIVTMLEIFREIHLTNINKWISRLVYLLLTIIFLFIVKQTYLNGSSGEQYKTAPLVSIGIISYLLFLLVPVLKRKTDKEQYIRSVVENQIIVIILSMILYLGMVLILFTIDTLIYNVDSIIYSHTFSLSVFIFGVTFFISRLKEVDENLEEYEISKVNLFLYSYIIIPLILIYTAILYIYFFKVIITLKLPEGSISHLVLWYISFSLFVLIMITPLVKRNKIISIFRKIFPIASILLLVMAFISIIERISKYAITENRYIIFMLIICLLFNMCMYIFRANVNNVFISLILIIFITVFSPWNMTKISINSQNKRLEKILTNNGILKNGKIIKQVKLNRNLKSDILSIVDYFDYGTDKSISDIKCFDSNKCDYKNRDEFLSKISDKDIWNYYDDIYKDISRKDKGYNIKGYDYLLNIDGSMLDADINGDDEYKITISDKKLITIIDKASKKEIMKIDAINEAKKVLSKLKDKIETENITEFSSQELSVKGENENIKYKIEFDSISSGDSINIYNMNLYIHVKR